MGVSDLPEAVGDVLGVSTDTGGLLLSCVVLMGVALALTVTKRQMDLLPMLVLLLAFAGLLTAIGWLSQWFLVLTAILIASLFGVRVAKGVLT